MRPPGFWPAILLLVAVNAFVGAMVGVERTLLPLLAEAEFGIASTAAATSFIVAFGATKAVVNLAAGGLADRFGRRRVLLAGWIAGAPIPFLLYAAPDWSFVVAANVLLGVNQGLAWSMTVNMKLDHAGPDARGLVVGLNEAAGYLGLAAAAFATGLLASTMGLRAPLLLGAALVVAGLALSLAARESKAPAPARGGLAAAFRDRALAAPSFAGLATNLKDGALWGLLPLLLASRGADLATIGLVVAAYPVAWGVGQLYFGPLSDRVGRRPLAVGGLALQAAGVVALVFAPGSASGLAAAVAVGVGTAMAYPTLLALVADIAPPATRATSLGVYRFWRDAGYAVGALGAGLVADAAGLGAALGAAAAVVALAALALGLSS